MDKIINNYGYIIIYISVLLIYGIYLYIYDKDNFIFSLINNNKINNNKIENIKFIINNKLVTFNKNSKNVALMVESRIFPNTEFIIRQFCRYLPEDFNMYIYATDNIYNDYLNIADKLNNNIIVKILPFKLHTIQDYNNIMLNISFWKMFDKFDRVLIFQNDTMIYKYNISDFYQYDYISAPWVSSQNITKNPRNVGLSMRNIKAILYCLENEDKVKIPYNNEYESERKNVFNGKYPESIFFSFAMRQFGYNVADHFTSSLFSIENSSFNNNTFGSHKLSVYNNKLYQKLLLRSIFNPTHDIVIPLKIYQTWHTKNLPPLMKRCTNLLKKANPEFEYYLYDDNDCIKFIYNNFDSDVLWAFNQLIPGAYKADLWRYCILYIKGGIYIDIKYNCINKFKLTSLLNKEYYVLDRYDIRYNDKGIYNGLMVCKPQNPLLLILINMIVYNVKNEYYGYSALCPTGPALFANMYEKYVKKINSNDFELKYSSDGMKILYNEIAVLQIYSEYRKEASTHQKRSHYEKLWNKRKIYKKKKNRIS